MTTKKPRMAWYEVEAAQLWALVGYTHTQIYWAMHYGSLYIRRRVFMHDCIESEAARIWLEVGYSQDDVDACMACRWAARSLGTRALP